MLTKMKKYIPIVIVMLSLWVVAGIGILLIKDRKYTPMPGDINYAAMSEMSK